MIITAKIIDATIKPTLEPRIFIAESFVLRATALTAFVVFFATCTDPLTTLCVALLVALID